MQPLAKQVLDHAAGLPEGTPLVAKELLHLGKRAAVDQALSRLVQRGALMRAGRGIRSAAASEPVPASGADARGKRDQGWVGTARPCPHLSMAMRSVKLRELPAGAETPSAQPPDANLAIRDAVRAARSPAHQRAPIQLRTAGSLYGLFRSTVSRNRQKVRPEVYGNLPYD